MDRPKITEPQHVVIDHVRHVVEIDGEPVPYWIAEGGPTTEPCGDHETLVKFQCFVIAKDVQIIGTPGRCGVASHLDGTFQCTKAREHDGQHGYAGIFWDNTEVSGS